MAIQIEEDENNDSYENNNNDNNRGGGGFSGGGGLGNIIGMILPFLFRNPKMGFGILIIGGLAYFVYSKFSGNSNNSNRSSQNSSPLARGADLSPEVFSEAFVFEPLSATGNTLPERMSLEQYAPTRKNQGEQGSCVGWGSAYAARTILEAVATGKNPDNLAFSPSFLYNQISLKDCQGSYVQYAMDNMLKVGSMPFTEFGYNDKSCSKKPNAAELQEAGQYKMRGSNRLTKKEDDLQIDFLAIKQNIAHKAPVVIGMLVGGSFMQDMMGQKVWKPTQADMKMRGFGGHCMTIIGYDDYLEGGAFQLMNSWGEEWGEKGLAWVRYADFKHFGKEAYGVFPLRDVKKPANSIFNAKVGLMLNESKKNIGFKLVGGNVFESVQALNKADKKGSKFKIQVTNSEECYTYVFAEENNASKVLFPYTKKHSPYCGITGTRLFPKDFSMFPDAVGAKDYMAVVMTKQAIDFDALNKRINNSKRATFAERVNEALAQETTKGTFQAGNLVEVQGANDNKNAIAIILAINKK